MAVTSVHVTTFWPLFAPFIDTKLSSVPAGVPNVSRTGYYHVPVSPAKFIHIINVLAYNTNTRPIESAVKPSFGGEGGGEDEANIFFENSKLVLLHQANIMPLPTWTAIATDLSQHHV